QQNCEDEATIYDSSDWPEEASSGDLCKSPLPASPFRKLVGQALPDARKGSTPGNAWNSTEMPSIARNPGGPMQADCVGAEPDLCNLNILALAVCFGFESVRHERIYARIAAGDVQQAAGGFGDQGGDCFASVGKDRVPRSLVRVAADADGISV